MKMDTQKQIQIWMKRDGIINLKKFLCVNEYRGIQVGDIVYQSYNIEGRLLYFAKIRNSVHESTMFFNNEIENSSNFSEIDI